MTLEFLVASAIAALVASGIYLTLRARTFQVVLGLTLLSHAINLFLFAAGRLVAGHHFGKADAEIDIGAIGHVLGCAPGDLGIGQLDIFACVDAHA